MIRFIIICLITFPTIAYAADTFVAKPSDFLPTEPTLGQTVTWKPNTPDAVSGLIFGTDAFSTITEASSVATAGDTIYIASGTYQEPMEIIVPDGVNLAGDGPGLTILDGESSHTLLSINGSSIIKDLTILNGFGAGSAGGISTFGLNVTLSNIHFTGNSSEGGIGAINIQSPQGQGATHVVEIEGCLFNNNIGNSSIYHEGDFSAIGGSNLIITNTTFSSNQGFAVQSLLGQLSLTQCTFYNNSSGAFDASDFFSTPGSSVVLRNSLVLDTYLGSNITSNGTNFIADGPVSAGDLFYTNGGPTVPGDIIDIVLSDNGGATATHKLSANSVAIDAGTNADAVDSLNNPLLFDQRGAGFPRISQGVVDIGAFEVVAPTLTISINAATIPENGGTAIVTVTRNTDPSTVLTVNLSSDDETEATLPATITFGIGESSTTVNLTSQNDDIADGTQTVTVTASAGGFSDATANVDISDDEVPTLTIAVSPNSISENGGTATVTISRNTDPNTDLTVDLFSDDPSRVNLPSTVDFVLGETEATVELTPIDNNIAEGDLTVTISASGEEFSPVDVAVDIIDDEVPTLTVSIDPASISENGGTATVTVTRNTNPNAELTVNLSSNDPSKVSLPASLTFAMEASATVTMFAINDDLADGTQTVTITASAGGFGDANASLDVTDDEVATLTLSIADTSISENGGSSIITVSRNTDTSSELTVSLSSGDPTEATVPANITIPAEASSATAALTAVDDAIVDGDQTVTIFAIASGFTDGSDQLEITDGDIPTLTLAIADTSISENGGSSIITISRNTDTSSELTVDLSSDDPSEAVLPATLTIPAGDISATATLTAVDDDVVDGNQPVTISATASGFIGDSDQLDITDDDVPTLTLAIADTSISENGDSSSVTISRNTDTSSSLVVDLASDDPSEATVPTTLTIPAGDISATAILTAVDDDVVDGNQLVTISATASGFTGDSDQLDITDDDVPTLTLAIADTSISENGGSSIITVSRNTDTSSELTISLSSNDPTEATVPASITIPAEASSSTVTLTAVDDTTVDGDQTVTIFAIASGFTDGSDQLDITDDDIPTLTLAIANTSISENGGSSTVTISRNTDTSGELTVDLSSDDPSEAILPATLTIPAGDISATATLTAVDDAIVDGTQTVNISTATSGFTSDSDVLDITDDDVPTLTLTIADPNISENGGSSIITVSRNTDTSSELTVSLSSGDPSEATVPGSITIPAEASFSTVTLTAVDDANVDGDQTVTIFAIASGFTDGSDQLDIIDDDISTLTLSIADTSISENGGSSIISVSRNTDTSSELTVSLSSSDSSEATVPASITIPAEANSSTVTLTAVDDAIVDGDQTVTIFAIASGFTDGSDQLEIIDDDIPTLTLSIADTGISENGGSSIITVSRNTDTSSELSVSLSSGDPSEATVPGSITIPAEATFSTVTLTAVDDAIVDGDQTVTISAAASGFIGASDVVNIADDDIPTLTLSIADTSISENGGSSTVTISRNTATINALTIDLSSDDSSEATVSNTLTIPAGDISAIATLTAVDDAVVDGDQTVSISATASGFIGDSDFLNVTDDDLLQITIEGGGTLSEPNSFSNSPFSPSETNLILRRNGTLGDVVVNIGIDPASQSEIGNDFTINGSTTSTFQVTIPDGESEFALRVQVIDDFAAEVDEAFVVLLLPGPFVSGNTSASILISQNDFGVTSLADFDTSAAPNDGEGTLRQAIINAKANLTITDSSPSAPAITFHPDIAGEIKIIAEAFLLDQSSFSIIGPGSEQIRISGEGISRVFLVSDPAQELAYSISGLTISNGFSGTNGGAIYSTESLRLSNCVLTDCNANIGGAISNEGILELQNCTLSNNTAVTYGGAIDNFSGMLSLDRCTLIENHADFGGGIENGAGSELWVDASTFSQNTALSSGGAIDSFGAIANISNTTISGNEAGFGGGIFNEASTVSIRQSTIVENIAITSVGGILTSRTQPVSTTIYNTIVAGNTKSGSPADLATNNASFENVDRASSNNLIGHAFSAGGLLNGINGNIVGAGTANIFAPLADNGGLTETNALLPGSPAIDAGNPAFALDSEGQPLTTDQRGFPRFVFSSNDIGAFEVSENPISIVSLEVTPSSSATIIWTSEAGVSYDVLRSTDLRTWQTIASGITAMNSITSWTDDHLPLDRAFYVVRSSATE